MKAVASDVLIPSNTLLGQAMTYASVFMPSKMPY
jgi:hypothetical protein